PALLRADCSRRRSLWPAESFAAPVNEARRAERYHRRLGEKPPRLQRGITLPANSLSFGCASLSGVRAGLGSSVQARRRPAPLAAAGADDCRRSLARRRP